MSLDSFAEIGAQDPDRAWPIFQALWNELTVPNKGAIVRPPVLLCMDNVSHIMTNSNYNTIQENGKLKPIHAHDFVLVKHFVDHLSGVKTLPNGGIILAATSLSEHAKSDALDVGIAMAEARQAQNLLPSPSSTIGSEGAKSAENQIRSEQFWNPYKKIDTRSLEALQQIHVMRLKGISKEEAKAIMEYWATSGMLRRKVEDGYVGEKWTLSGNGVLGELEKAVVRRGKI
jgi:small subunit ribosomal protein S29